MSRTLALVTLAVLLAGCTRYGTRTNGPFSPGPFAPRPKSDPTAAIPVGPPANSSPLALATDLQPEPPLPPDINRVVPVRLPLEPAALGNGFGTVIPAGGIPPLPSEDALAFPPLRPRRPKTEPQPNQFPSPFAPREPKDKGTPGMEPPSAAKTPEAKNPGAGAGDAAAQNLAELKKLVAFAAERWGKVTDYEATITRRELTPKGMNSEVLVFQFRKEPMSLFTRTIGENGKGREVVYNPGKYGDKLHIMIGEGDHKLMKAGFRAPAISPDDDRVKEKARYSLRESGFGVSIERVNTWVAKLEAGKIPAGSLTFTGAVTRPESREQLIGVQLVLRPGDDPLFPTGGLRQWFFDVKEGSPSCGMPVVIVGYDAKNTEIEYYFFDKIKSPAGLTDADFSPDRLGKKK